MRISYDSPLSVVPPQDVEENPPNIFIYASSQYISFMKSEKGLDEVDESPLSGKYVYRGEITASFKKLFPRGTRGNEPSEPHG